MKFVILFCAMLAIVYGEDQYTDQFDSVNIDDILQSDRLLNNYYGCLVTGSKCTPDGLKLREILPDALQSMCKKCSEVQRRQSKKVIDFLVKNKVEMYKELEKIFDPNHEYRKAFADELKAAGIVLPD